ncbi:hypothetical protein JYT75_00745, partial [Oceanicaulis sp. AH-315-P02]|nr:hypothetical protein [Oceanicaulis sp. AH-315-P02]
MQSKPCADTILLKKQETTITKPLHIIVAAIFFGLLSACATPVSHTNLPLSTYDKNTQYNILDRSDGFGLTVFYSRYQFVPESDAVATACKSQLTAIAW